MRKRNTRSGSVARLCKRRGDSLRTITGPVPELSQGKRREDIPELLDDILAYLIEDNNDGDDSEDGGNGDAGEEGDAGKYGNAVG